MNTTNFDWGDDLIDSRDIISRHEELKQDYSTIEVENETYYIKA
jgi:hypothetical protein